MSTPSATLERPTGQAPDHPPHARLRLAKGIVKALFTTSPSQPTEVVVYDDEVAIQPASEELEEVGASR